MRLLSLDLGITTGYAVLTEGGAVLEHGTLRSTDLVKRRLNAISRRLEVTHIVVEKPLIIGNGNLARNLETVVRRVLAAFPDADEVTPAQWKQTPFRAEPVPRETSPHERDAIRLGLYYLNSLKAT